MSTEPVVSQRTAEALRELQSGLDLYRKNEGKKQEGMTNERLRSLAEQIAIILADPDYPLEQFLSELSVLPPAISACGAVRAWPQISKERRAGYLCWLGTLKPKQAVSSKAILIPGLVEHSPEISIDLLCSSSSNKRLRDHLAETLLANAGEKISLLIESTDSKNVVRKILDCLLELTGSPKISAEEKWPTIRLALSTMVDHNLHEGAGRERLIHLIREQMQTFPPAIKQEMRSVLIELDAHLVADFFPSQEVTTESSHESMPETGPTRILVDRNESVAARSTRAEGSDIGPPAPFPGADISADAAPSAITQQLSDWLTSLRQKVTLLQELEEYLRTLEERLKKADEAAQVSQQQRESLRRDLAAMKETEKTLQADLDQKEATFLKTQSELYERIESNAERRLEEYRKGLASECAPLFRRVPARRSPVSLETGEALLARLYEVIDFLENKGIRVLPGPGDRQ